MKKGQTDMFLDVVSYVLFTVIVIAFFIIFHLIKGCNNPSVEQIISEADMKRDIDLMLVNVLRSPVGEGKMTDLIWLYYQDDDYEEKLSEEIMKAMKRVPSDYPCWEIEIIDEDVLQSFDSSCPSTELGDFRSSLIKIALPINDKSLTLDVKLTQYEYQSTLYGMS